MYFSKHFITAPIYLFFFLAKYKATRASSRVLHNIVHMQSLSNSDCKKGLSINVYVSFIMPEIIARYGKVHLTLDDTVHLTLDIF